MRLVALDVRRATVRLAASDVRRATVRLFASESRRAAGTTLSAFEARQHIEDRRLYA